MGRAKLKMELIEKQKSRAQTLKKRKECLTKKLHELSTLCGVPACMIVYDPSTNSSEIWPHDSADVRRLIDGYDARSKELGGVRSYGLPDFFNERQKQIEADLLKLRKRNLQAKFPTWHDSLCFMDESQLRNFAAALRAKAAGVRSRIDFFKTSITLYPNFYGLDHVQQIKNVGAMELPPNYYYAPPTLPVPQPYMVYTSMDQNVNWWADCGDDITRYLLH